MKLKLRDLAVDAVLVLGALTVAGGLALVYLPLGVVVAGVFLILAALVSR